MKACGRKLRILVRRILRKYKCPPDQTEKAAQLVLNQAEPLCEAWLVLSAVSAGSSSNVKDELPGRLAKLHRLPDRID